MRADTLAPAKTALLLMDFQPGILASFADADALVQRVRAAQQWARATGILIVYVRVAFIPQDYASISVRNKIFSRLAGRQSLVDGSPDAGIHPLLEPQEGEIVVTKTRVGAFSTTNLSVHLNARGIDTLILAGVSTSGVVLSTVRDAADRDYRLIILSDCCADASPEVHRVLTEEVFPRQADVIGIASLASLFD